MDGEEDIKARPGKARGAFVKLNRGVWISSSVSRKTKIRLYKTLVKSVLVYGCKTWKVNEGDAKKPDNDCVTALTWTPEEKRKRDRPKTT